MEVTVFILSVILVIAVFFSSKVAITAFVSSMSKPVAAASVSKSTGLAAKESNQILSMM